MKYTLNKIIIIISLCLCWLPIKASIDLKVGETYTCKLGNIPYFKECVWTTSDYQCLNFVGTVTNYTTEVKVKAIAKPSYVTPVTVHCQYNYYDLDPTTGRYTYLRSGYKDFQFFIKENDSGEITVTPGEIVLEPGESRRLSAQVSGNLSVDWSSSNSSVASVDNEGKVTANSQGNAVITATASNGQKGYCYVTVKSSYVAVIDVSLDKYTLTLNLGDTQQLTANVLPSDATDKKVSWNSYNNNIATVSNSGLVKAVGKGETIVYCKTNDGGYEAYCSIKVNDSKSDLYKWDVKQITTSGRHTMILLSDGSLMACGRNSDGQLGDGTTTNRLSPVKIMENVSAVSTGNTHSMIIKTDGTLWACGRNSDGQLGDGTTTNRLSPVKIMENVSAVSTGNTHSMIIKTDGTLWACGDNSYGQLGDGTNTNRYTPVKIMENVATVCAGLGYTMIIKNNGSLWACGWNSVGELGDGTTTNRSSPVKIMESVSTVCAGNSFTMIIKKDESLWACGYNNHGQLCDGTTTKRNTPVKIMMDVSAVSTGNFHSMIIKTDGTLWACGMNNKGQLCNGSTTDRTSPVKVLEGVTAVSAGSTNTMFLTNDGSLWVCGYNESGQLCDGTTKDKSSPIQLSEPSGSSDINTIYFSNRHRHQSIYNLSGSMLKIPQKGINIINGKKVVIK